MSTKPQRSEADDQGLGAWLTLLHAHSVLIDALEEDLQKERGLPLGWFEVLLQVTSAPEGQMKMQELAHSVLLSKSGVTRLVDRMEAAGLVSRVACPTDRRAVYAVATPAGRDLLGDAITVHTASLARHFTEVLTPAEVVALRATLQKILDARGFEPPPCPSLLKPASQDELAVLAHS
jgi:DNA-binding MarR family transcriptional regulator